MPEYIVKTINDRNLVIEASSFPRFNVDAKTYEFWRKEGYGITRLVASVPLSNVFAVFESNAELSDHYSRFDWNEEEKKEAATPPPTQDSAPTPSPRRVERRVCKGRVQWGFVDGDRFAPYGEGPYSKDDAQEAADGSIPLSEFYTVPLSETEVIQ